MNKLYTFFLVVPIIALLFIKAVAVYEFDTKQRYIKNLVDNTVHKVMLTGVLTVGEKQELIEELNKLGHFEEQDMILNYGSVQSDGTLGAFYSYVPGNVLERGEVFSIYVKSGNESTFSRLEGNAVEDDKLYYKAKAACRVEKKQPEQ